MKKKSGASKKKDSWLEGDLEDSLSSLDTTVNEEDQTVEKMKIKKKSGASKKKDSWLERDLEDSLRNLDTTVNEEDQIVDTSLQVREMLPV